MTTTQEKCLGENQLTEPSLISNEVQIWTQFFEQKIMTGSRKKREEMDNKLETILMEIRTNRNVSTTTNPMSETIDMQNSQPSGFKTDRSIGVHASNTKNSDLEDDDYPLRPSDMKDLRHPAKPLYKIERDLDATVVSNEDSEEEDYHKY